MKTQIKIFFRDGEAQLKVGDDVFIGYDSIFVDGGAVLDVRIPKFFEKLEGSYQAKVIRAWDYGAVLELVDIDPFDGKKFDIYEFNVVGVTFENRQAYLQKCYIDNSEALITCLQEKDNKYDSNAISVNWNDKQIGYVPKKDAAEITGLINDGYQIQSSDLVDIGVMKDKDIVWVRVQVVLVLDNKEN